jgi:hypothetical protein
VLLPSGVGGSRTPRVADSTFFGVEILSSQTTAVVSGVFAATSKTELTFADIAAEAATSGRYRSAIKSRSDRAFSCRSRTQMNGTSTAAAIVATRRDTSA